MPARAHRALASMAAAALLIGVAGVMYLHAGLARPGGPATATTATPRPGAFPGSISFGDADHGALTLFNTAPTGTSSTWLTSDGGHTWRRFNALGSVPVNLAFDGPRHAVASALVPGGGALVTDDGGRIWRPLTPPWSAPTVAAGPAFLDADNGWWLQRLDGQGFAGQSHPVVIWRTSDGGRAWQQLPGVGIPDAGIKGPLLFADLEHAVLVVATHPHAAPSLLITADGGRTWVAAATLDDPVSGTDLLGVSLFVHSRRLVAVPLWVAGADVVGGSIRLGPNIASHAFVSISDDAGRSWGPLRAAPTISGVAGPVAPTLDDRGRLILLNSHRLWASEDGGVTWPARVAVLPEGLESIGPIVAVPGALFVFAEARGRFSDRELLSSRDRGIHWSVLPLPRRST